MRKAADSQQAQILGEIGDILSQGVDLWLNQQLQAENNEPKPSQPDDLPEESCDEVESILQYIRTHRRVSISEIMDFTGLPRSTARRRVDELVAAEKVQRRGKGRGVIYMPFGNSAET